MNFFSPPLCSPCFVHAASRPVTFNKYAFIVLYSIVEAQILHHAPFLQPSSTHSQALQPHCGTFFFN